MDERFVIDMVHNMEELAELQKEISKWVRGSIRRDKLIEEINDVEIALVNLRNWLFVNVGKGVSS
jgi:NTP pyrophosphatase (non-canonical NTP hydrolase)